jgi:hypothetical protein
MLLWATNRRTSDGLPGGQQVVCALDPQAVRQREITLHVTRVHRFRNRGQLMDDHIRSRPAHGLRDLIGIKRISDHRHRAQLVKRRSLGLAPRHPMNLMTRGNQKRQQLPSNRSRRTCHKHSHHQTPRSRLTYTHKTRQRPRP